MLTGLALWGLLGPIAKVTIIGLFPFAAGRNFQTPDYQLFELNALRHLTQSILLKCLIMSHKEITANNSVASDNIFIALHKFRTRKIDMRRRFRKFVKGAPYHYCNKGLNGFCIFYSFKDYLFLITLYSVLAREMGIHTLAFTPMINHIHSLLKVQCVETLSAFVQRLESVFAQKYNEYHHRRGQLFKHRFGGAPKSVGKLISGCIIYILNNPVVGNMFSKALNFRWNLLAYAKSVHPFSPELVIRQSSTAMKKAVKTVDAMYRSNLYLGYPVLDELFAHLNPTEIRQLTDYILSLYNFLDYEALYECFGSFDNVVIAAEASSGSEYDVPDDWDDYGVYAEMIKVLRREGYDSDFNPESLDQDELTILYSLLTGSVTATREQMRKFLHLK